MRRQLKVMRKRQIAASVILAGICVIGLVYSDALQQKERLRSPAPAEVPGVAGISQPFSFANSTAKAPAPKVVIVSAEKLLPLETEPAEEAGADLDLAQAGRDAQSAPSWIPAPGRLDLSRPSMLYLRRSLPTFDQTRSTRALSPSRSLLAASAARYLDTPFNSLLDNVFKHAEDAGSYSDASRQKQDSRNPFTEAKQKAESEAPPSNPVASAPPAPPPVKDTTPPAGDQTAKDTPPATSQPATGGSTPKPAAPEGPMLILGDFSGNGTLEARNASQIADGVFSFADGQRTFSLFVNPAAVELQRSFAIDDFNKDGMPDLLVTSRAALLGAILLGNGNGDFKTTDTFVTGYEPTVPVPGVLRDTYREILSVNVRTGMVQTFRKTDYYRLARGQAVINFIPDFLARVTEVSSGADCLLAAQSGKSAQVYQLRNDSSLNSSDNSLPTTTSISIDKDFLQENALGNLQVYQVGSSASILLTNSRRTSFNVANFRLYPQIFLVVGDITRKGTLDVAVAYLLSTTPVR